MQRGDQHDTVLRATIDLARWLADNGLAGWDPYDLLGHPLIIRNRLRLIGNPRTSRLGFKLDAALKRHPLAFRRLLFVKQRVNAKGCGLLAAAWTRASCLGIPGAHDQSRANVDWLLRNPSTGHPGVSWGYPFNWQSRVYIPKGTPSAVVTSTCGQGLLDYFDHFGDEQALPAARGAAEFLSAGLNQHHDAEGRVCLSYTPVDDFQVHNANLMAAEYLLRAARFFGVAEWEDLAQRCLAFTLAQQREDGSFDYWSDEQSTGLHIDNYHTGFVLRSLNAFASAGYEEAASALDRGWPYYHDNLVMPEGEAPRDLPGVEVPLNIHSCAESVLCPSALSERFPRALQLAQSKADWSLEHMRNPDGSFAYMLESDGISRIPYLRWSEAWMFRAVTELAYQEMDSRTKSTTGPN